MEGKVIRVQGAERGLCSVRAAQEDIKVTQSTEKKRGRADSDLWGGVGVRQEAVTTEREGVTTSH